MCYNNPNRPEHCSGLLCFLDWQMELARSSIRSKECSVPLLAALGKQCLPAQIQIDLKKALLAKTQTVAQDSKSKV